MNEVVPHSCGFFQVSYDKIFITGWYADLFIFWKIIWQLGTDSTFQNGSQGYFALIVPRTNKAAVRTGRALSAKAHWYGARDLCPAQSTGSGAGGMCAMKQEGPGVKALT